MHYAPLFACPTVGQARTLCVTRFMHYDHMHYEQVDCITAFRRTHKYTGYHHGKVENSLHKSPMHVPLYKGCIMNSYKGCRLRKVIMYTMLIIPSPLLLNQRSYLPFQPGADCMYTTSAHACTTMKIRTHLSSSAFIPAVPAFSEA
jgi:hypothetical protein